MNINARLKTEPGGNKYGAFMGRDDWRGDPDREYKFNLQKVQLHDGDYDAGGAYWGNTPSNPLWAAWCVDKEGGEIRMFLRATSRDKAKIEVLDYYPNARFFR